jgi:hypothetical protein
MVIVVVESRAQRAESRSVRSGQAAASMEYRAENKG